MPIAIIIKSKKVNLNIETSSIVDAYKESLKERLLSTEGGEDISYAAPKETQSKTGVWARYVANTLEAITQCPHGARVLPLAAFEVELEAPAELLLRSYLAFLNNILLKQGFNALHTEKPEVTSKYVLIRELLYRLVVIALSNKLDYLHDGDNLLAALRSFIKKIIESEQLIEKTSFTRTKKLSPFLLELSTSHPQWIRQIEQMVSIVKMIRSNSKTISNTLIWLKSVENTIQRQLIAFIDAKTEPSMLADEWLDTTLEKCENKLLENKLLENKFKDTDKNSLLIREHSAREQLELHERQNMLLTCLANNKFVEIKRAKIGGLYNLLNQTHFLHQIMSNMDLLMTYTSWMPILAGVISFDKLAELMSNHSQRCEQILEIPKELQWVLQEPAGRGLAKYGAITGNELSYSVLHNVQELSSLQNSVLKQRIGNMIVSALSSLIRLQDRLPLAHHFINVDRVTQLYVSTDFQPLPSRVLEMSQQIIEDEKIAMEFKTEIATLKEENQRLQRENMHLAGQAPQELMLTQLLHANLMANCQSLDVLEMLKTQGARLEGLCNQQTPFYGYTALHIAASTDNLIACRWLLDQGRINVNILDSQGETALDKANKRKLFKIVDFLKEQGGQSKQSHSLTQELHRIIDSNHITEDDNSVNQSDIEKLEMLINQGADVNGINELQNSWQGDRPLHTLIVKGNKKLIIWFMFAGANPELPDLRRQETPYERFLRVCFDEAKQSMKNFLADSFPGRFFQSEQPRILALYNSGASSARLESSRNEEDDKVVIDFLTLYSKEHGELNDTERDESLAKIRANLESEIEAEESNDSSKKLYMW